MTQDLFNILLYCHAFESSNIKIKPHKGTDWVCILFSDNSTTEDYHDSEIIVSICTTALFIILMIVNIVFGVGVVFRHIRHMCCTGCFDDYKEPYDPYLVHDTTLWWWCWYCVINHSFYSAMRLNLTYSSLLIIDSSLNLKHNWTFPCNYTHTIVRHTWIFHILIYLEPIKAAGSKVHPLVALPYLLGLASNELQHQKESIDNSIAKTQSVLFIICYKTPCWQLKMYFFKKASKWISWRKFKYIHL